MEIKRVKLKDLLYREKILLRQISGVTEWTPVIGDGKKG